jgi:hypothetical protein
MCVADNLSQRVSWDDWVKSTLYVWINGVRDEMLTGTYICLWSILKRPTYFFSSSYLAQTPTPPLPISYLCWYTSRFFTSLLVLLLSVLQVYCSIRGVGGGGGALLWVPEAGTVGTIMQLCPLHLPGPLTFCLTALLVRQLLQRDGMGILEFWPVPQHALFESYRMVEIFQQLELRVQQLSSLSRITGTVSRLQLPSQYNHAPPSVPLLLDADQGRYSDRWLWDPNCIYALHRNSPSPIFNFLL